MGVKLKIALILLLSIFFITACQSDEPETKQEEAENKVEETETDTETEIEETEPKTEEPAEPTYTNWTTFGYDLGLNRHVPFEEITAENVSELGLVWSKNFKEINENIPNGNQNFPLVVDGTAYVTTSGNFVYAFDALTGDVIWEWEPPAEITETTERMGMPTSNRGVAIGEGKVFMLTGDVGLVSIDQETGETVDFIHLSDYYPSLTPENGYYETTAPIYYDGKVFVGSSGGDNGVRGFEMAFKSSDLTPAWDEPFWTVPPKGESWLANGLFGGGGAVWMPPSVDEETGIVYFSAGNPAPDFYGEKRPGANPNTNSVIAVEADTGKLVWVKQQMAHDLWDYDTADSPSIVKATVDGEERKLVIVGTKASEWFAYDAATGEEVYGNVLFGKSDHPTPTTEGVLVYPGILGGQNYAPDTFDPELNLVLIPGIEEPSIIKVAENEEEAQNNDFSEFFGAMAFGTSYAPAPEGIEGYGTVTAIDLNDGTIKYQIETNEIMRGGLTSTTTGLTFFGELSGKIKAIETETGEVVWDFQTTGDTISAAPSFFEKDGKSYMMITSAGSQPQIFLFALGGDKSQGESAEADSEDAHTGE
ncbi:pyrroloquinoline quinone-dependent dehydrogenase [Aquibacillus saliphilus]|uniref:pyrroloquinoline quinone-dependent dehydrogenase n=1 Tax=Aquibacillus saliphilus TaxID=1909422 RepID=UPI001CEFC2FF|nr:PQQ-binding-like beta-propeller repeat protein [Aquibacillus saliphilus]